MKISFLHYSYPEVGGTETVTNNLCKFYSMRGHRISIISWKRPSKNINSEFETIYLPDSSDFNSETNNRWIEAYVNDEKIDCIINQGPFWIPTVKLKESSCYIISVLHYAPNYKIISQRNQIDLTFHQKSPTISHWIKSTVRYLFKNFFAKRDFDKIYCKQLNEQINNSDKFIVLCDEYIHELNDITNECHNNVVAISNGLKLGGYKLTKKKKNVLCIGRLSHWDKRIDRLIRMWRVIEKKCPDWNLLILGDGEDRDNLVKLTKRYNLERCRFEGFVDIQSYLETASILAMTSSSEGFPMVLIESQSYGVIPIAYNVSAGISHIIKDQINGFLVSPFNERKFIECMTNLMNDENTREKMSRNALTSSAEYSISKMGDRYLKLITEGVRQKNGID